MWIVVGDIILLSLREFQDDRADVIHRYTPDEARNLKTYGELKDFQLVENQEAGGEEDEEGGIEFEEADIDDICKSIVLQSCLKRQLLIAAAEMVGLVFLIYENASNYLVFIALFLSPYHMVHNIMDAVMPVACGLRNSEEWDGAVSKLT